MPRKRRPLARIPGFRPAPYVEFMERMYSDVGITEEHVDEFDGRVFITPSLIENDDEKEGKQ